MHKARDLVIRDRVATPEKNRSLCTFIHTEADMDLQSAFAALGAQLYA